MKNEAISERQGIILIILFLLGNSLLVGSGNPANKDAWLAIIIAISWSIILFLIFSRILSLYPGKDLFDILPIVMGKFLGKIISILMIWFAFHTGLLIIRIISEFTNILVFPDTPVVIPMIFFTILLISSLNAGIEVLGRWAEFFSYIVILIVLIVPLLSITQMDINRLKPLLDNGLSPLLNGAFSSFSFPFGEVVIFTMVFSNISKIKNYKKIFMVGLFVGGGLIVLTVLRNILVLGSESVSSVYFASSMAVSLIRLGFLQRLELTVIIVFLVCIFVKVSICTFAVCNGISKVFGFDDYKFIVTPIVLLMLNISFFIYRHTMEMAFFTYNIWQYYAFPFEVIIPLVVFIRAEIKSRRSTFNFLKYPNK
ncbi:GerAB/ArcD/ProY family transporter [Clostridium estertheticum]|uniref:GerAB/ArcD/ProY family transporter n=1 Tax=Clostridium estertheticum TaxID=238834 RepID=UPI001C7E11B5|nr:endospore germination permease [Clostridium estertheticum]MBX4267948.1 endospore germination permease [Clostridium estertheticum]WLC78177.1 endospore germination permease [Clostridium estertheticum]